jgi:hypothetical protein
MTLQACATRPRSGVQNHAHWENEFPKAARALDRRSLPSEASFLKGAVIESRFLGASMEVFLVHFRDPQSCDIPGKQKK